MAKSTQVNAMNSEDVRLTPAAAERVREFLARDGGIGLRVEVKRTGCSGWAYDVGLAREVADDDHVFEQQGVQVVVSPQAMKLVGGTTIDFVDQGLVREFRFSNPNVTGECGCGESFTVSS